MKEETMNLINEEQTEVYDYDKSLAVKCNNGTFIGKETERYSPRCLVRNAPRRCSAAKRCGTAALW